MPAPIALLLTICLVVYLFRQDRREHQHIPGALWFPLVWMLITATRLPSQWLSLQGNASAATIYQDGNAFDRIFYLVLMGLSIYVLHRRGTVWSRVFRSNIALTIFLIYCLLSIFWSDFTFVAFKRWYRDLGVYLTALVVVSDAKPLDAIRLLFRRFAYIVLPFSITLIKYFPEIGMQYSQWTGEKLFTGIAANKTGLGSLCFVSGLFLVWDLLRRRHNKESGRRFLMIDFGLLGMIGWLFYRVDSKTATICFLLGTTILLMCQMAIIRRDPKRILVLVVMAVVIFVPLNIVFDLNSVVYRAAGRDATLTGRVDLWEDIQRMNVNPFFGTGYESFWLGDRLAWLWSRHDWAPNQAHNGYLEVYINIGLVGLTLLLIFLLATLIKVRKCLVTNFQLGTLTLTLFATLLLYNFTEAAFKYHVNWYAFLVLALGTATDFGTLKATKRAEIGATMLKSRRVVRQGDPVPTAAPIAGPAFSQNLRGRHFSDRRPHQLIR